MSESRHLTVVRAGLLTTIQDGGRPGLAHLAIPPSGAVDQPAFRLANRLVGNPEHMAVLETTLTGVAVRCSVDCAVAVTGAHAHVAVDGSPSQWGAAIHVRAGEVVDVRNGIDGARSYLAVSGGILAPTSFGSRSTDILSGIGPAPLRANVSIPIGEDLAPAEAVDVPLCELRSDVVTLRLYTGPRADLLERDAARVLEEETWTVGLASNRIGMRLEGPQIRLRDHEELPSEGVVIGSMEITPDGMPLVMLADHPTTGGYPVVGVVDATGVAKCGQAKPGTAVRFSVIHDELDGIYL